jgi:hypothetical protein
MPMAHQAHLPFNLLTLFGQTQLRPHLAAERTAPLGFIEPVLNDLFGQLPAPLAFRAWTPTLLASGARGRSLGRCRR